MKKILVNIRLWQRFAALLLPHKRRWLVLLFLSAVTGIISIVYPYLTKMIIDGALAKRDFALFIRLIVLAGLIFLVGEAASRLKEWFYRTIRISFFCQLNRKLFSHMQNLDYSWFQQRSLGSHLYTVTHDTDTVVDFLTSILPQLLSLLPRMVITIGIVFMLDRRIAVLTAVSALILYLPAHFFNRKIESKMSSYVLASENFFNYIQEVFSRIQLIKLLRAQKEENRRFQDAVEKAGSADMDQLSLETWMGLAIELAGKIILALVFVWGGWLIIQGRMSLGTLTAIIMYLSQAIALEGQLANAYQVTIAGTISCERLARILDEPAQQLIQPGQKKILPILRARISFKDVSFGYSHGLDVLHSLSFTLAAGKTIALAGPSGVGKTTIANLIMRLFIPRQGQILINEFALEDIDEESLSRLVAIASQEPLLWNDTIFRNIEYGDGGVSPENVYQAARMAGVSDFAESFTLGYDTNIGENATLISEGQKQKIAIARSLVREPRILILDEAMASMDSASEERILTDIRKHYPDMTILIVSHRLSTVLSADIVCYLRNANTIAVGDPQKLIKDFPSLEVLFGAQKK
jgi:ABC-type bacteriocin/lantibiotic exporter with double-glycine peptidase domain